MALTAATFIEPAGMLNAAMFPDADLETYVAAWITDAEAQSAVEAARSAWVMYRALDALTSRMMREASTVAGDDIREVISAEQLAYWTAERARYYAAFQVANGASLFVATLTRDEDE